MHAVYELRKRFGHRDFSVCICCYILTALTLWGYVYIATDNADVDAHHSPSRSNESVAIVGKVCIGPIVAHQPKA